MKAIQLTEDHKSKLLEMCKVLFPELNLEMYYDDDISDNWEEAIENNSCGNDAQVGYLISNWHKQNAKIIHWFEFCYGPLLSAIFNHINYPRKVAWYDDTNGRVEFGNKFTWYNEEAGHPVTFLYEEFLKLKL